MGAIVACGTCGRRFQVGRRKSGRTIVCTHCGGQIFVPTADHQGDLDLGGDGADEALSDMLAASEPPRPASHPAPVLRSDPLAAGLADLNPNAALPSLPPGGLPGIGVSRLKRPVAAPEWYANPLVWMGIAGAAIVFLLLVALLARKQPPHTVADKSNVASTSSLTALTGLAVGTGDAAVNAASQPGEVSAPTGPPGQEVFAWDVPPNGVDGSNVVVVATLAVPMPVERNVVAANHQGYFVIIRDFSEATRIAWWNLLAGSETKSWRGAPVDPLSESLSQRGTVYAAVEMVEGVCQLCVVQTGLGGVERVPLNWSGGLSGSPVFMTVAGEKQIVIASPGGAAVEVWSVDRKLVSRWPGDWPQTASAYAVSPAGGCLAMLTPNARLTVLDLTTGKIVGEASAAGLRECLGMAYSLDGTELAALFATGELAVWDMSSGRRRGTHRVEVAAAHRRTVPVQGIGRHGGWLVQGRVAVDDRGATRWLVEDQNKQPALMVSGRDLLTFETRDGIAYLRRERAPVTTSQ